MSFLQPPPWVTDDEKSIRIVPPATYGAETYRGDAHQAGMDETLRLLVGDSQVPHSGRPGAALRRLARTVTDELACLGIHGITINVGDGMARVIAANRARAARRAVAS